MADLGARNKPIANHDYNAVVRDYISDLLWWLASCLIFLNGRHPTGVVHVVRWSRRLHGYLLYCTRARGKSTWTNSGSPVEYKKSISLSDSCVDFIFSPFTILRIRSTFFFCNVCDAHFHILILLFPVSSCPDFLHCFTSSFHLKIIDLRFQRCAQP